MSKADFSIALRNYAGVPVVELVGEINEKTISVLNDMLDKLVRAGHYNVMVNLKRAVWGDASPLKPLEKVARAFQTHYGNLNIVAEIKQISGLQEASPLAQMLKFCTSEGQALMQIKKLPAASVGGVTPMSAHLAEN